MPIKQMTPQKTVDAYLREELERREQALVNNLIYVGEKCVNIAKDTMKAAKNYKDQTGNLRSSVGYVIAKDGKIIKKSSFKTIKNGAEGGKKGLSFAQAMAQYENGLVLVLVAGMNYAVHVQRKGYDVLSSAELLAEKLVPLMLKKLGLG